MLLFPLKHRVLQLFNCNHFWTFPSSTSAWLWLWCWTSLFHCSVLRQFDRRSPLHRVWGTTSMQVVYYCLYSRFIAWRFRVFRFWVYIWIFSNLLSVLVEIHWGDRFPCTLRYLSWRRICPCRGVVWSPFVIFCFWILLRQLRFSIFFKNQWAFPFCMHKSMLWVWLFQLHFCQHRHK